MWCYFPVIAAVQVVQKTNSVFLVLKPNADPKVVSQKNFFAGVPQVKNAQQGDTIHLQLGYNAGKKHGHDLSQ